MTGFVFLANSAAGKTELPNSDKLKRENTSMKWMNEPTWTVGLGKGVYHSTSVYNVQIKNGIHLNFRVDRVVKEKWDFWNYSLVIAVCLCA